MRIISFCLFVLLSSPLHADDFEPDPGTVEAAMAKAAAFFRNNLSVAGGYASTWPKDLSEGRSEHHATPTVIEIQPPGTPTVGLAMFHAFEAAQDKAVFRQGALEAARALYWCQLSTGGWSPDYDFDMRSARRYHHRRDLLAGDTDPGKREIRTTLDDNKTQSAMLFLLELAANPEITHPEIEETIEFGLTTLIAAQAPNGGYPQQYEGPWKEDTPVIKASYPDTWSREYPKEKYYHYYTLNDGNLENVMRLFLRAYELRKEERFLEAAKKLGDFHLLAQMPEPQPAWAQQYNYEMHPAWARKFEPPSISSMESLRAIGALMELWVMTGDDKYKAPIPAALDWLEKVRLPEGGWARFYELKTDKPLYFTKDTYILTYDDSDLPTHYGFKIDDSLGRKIQRIRDDLERPRDYFLRYRSGPQTPEKWAERARGLRGKVKQALESQNNKGYWLDGDIIDARLFAKNMNAMADYVRAVREAEKATQ